MVTSESEGKPGLFSTGTMEGPMYVGVVHTVTDKAVWAKKLKEFAQAKLPEGYANPITYIGSRTDYAFCLWDVPSVEALQPMLDELTEGAATNMYFPVDPDAFGTAGIPAQRIDLETRAQAKA